MDKILQDRIQLNLDGLEPTKDRAMVDLWAEGFRKGGIPVRAFFGDDHLPAFRKTASPEKKSRPCFSVLELPESTPFPVTNGGLTARKMENLLGAGRGRLLLIRVIVGTREMPFACDTKRDLGGLRSAQRFLEIQREHTGKKEYFYCSDLGFPPFSLVK